MSKERVFCELRATSYELRGKTGFLLRFEERGLRSEVGSDSMIEDGAVYIRQLFWSDLACVDGGFVSFAQAGGLDNFWGFRWAAGLNSGATAVTHNRVVRVDLRR